MHLLIVDDEHRFANMLAKRLMLRGYSSEIAHDGRSAILLMEKNEYRLVLLDLRLPDMDGVEVLAQVKSRWPATAAIILTGHGTEKDRKKCQALNAYAFLHKPLNMAELITILNEVEEMSV